MFSSTKRDRKTKNNGGHKTYDSILLCFVVPRATSHVREGRLHSPSYAQRARRRPKWHRFCENLTSDGFDCVLFFCPTRDFAV